jgi:hypothetical protein
VKLLFATWPLTAGHASRERKCKSPKGAAGATGSVAGQIAKNKYCRVLGTAGGKDKCDWLVNEAHFDAAIDYKSSKREHQSISMRTSASRHKRSFLTAHYANGATG